LAKKNIFKKLKNLKLAKKIAKKIREKILILKKKF